MAITQNQLEQRRKHIGASDVAAILNVDPFRSPYDVWAEKTGRVESFNENNAMRVGKIMELSAILFAEEQLGKITRNQRRVLKGWNVLAANTDGILKATGEPVEAKTTNITSRASELGQWGDDGTDQVPQRVILQCTAQMAACEANLCYVAAIIGGRGFALFKVPFDTELFKIVLDKLQYFWDYNVAKDIAPDGALPSMDVVKSIKRIPEKTVEISKSIIDDWINAKDVLKKAEQEEEKARSKMLAVMDDAEAATCDGGMVTYFQQGREVFDTKKFKGDYPDIAEKYINRVVYRVPRFKKLLLEENNG